MTQLPTIRLFSELYFVDNRLKQLRHTEDPHDYIEFSEFGAMLQLSALSIKHSGGAEAHSELTKTLLRQATDLSLIHILSFFPLGLML